MKTALIMEGGAMRGMFTCGIIDIFLENGITFDAASGISAGAVFGCNYKSKQIGRAIRYNKKYCKDKRYCSINSLIKTGNLYGEEFCYNTLPYKLDIFDIKTYKENPMPFYVGTTSVTDGKTIFHNCDSGDEYDMKWFQASASMPVVSKPVKIDDMLLLDGGISCAVPYEYMEKLGYLNNVIILTQPKGYRKKEKKLNLIFKFLLRKYPKIIEAMNNRPYMYNKQMDEIDNKEAEGTVIVIRPPRNLKIGHREKNKKELERVYQIGRKEGLKALNKVKQFINN